MGLMDRMKIQMAKQALKMLQSNDPRVLDLIAKFLPKDLTVHLENLKNIFAAKGLGHILDSWTGPGPKLAITPQQVREILGEDKLAEISRQIDTPPEEMAELVATWLPVLVERMSKPVG